MKTVDPGVCLCGRCAESGEKEEKGKGNNMKRKEKELRLTSRLQ
jgi:hypothetical protein